MKITPSLVLTASLFALFTTSAEAAKKKPAKNTSTAFSANYLQMREQLRWTSFLNGQGPWWSGGSISNASVSGIFGIAQ